jgi:hypothetical protein
MANSLDFRVKNGLVVATTATIQSSTNSTSTLTGALVVTGGVGIGKDLYVGGTIYGAHTGVSTTATNATNIIGGVAGYIPIQSASGVTAFISTGTVGQLLQMQIGNTATWVSTGSLVAGIATSATNITGGTAGSIHIQSAPGVTTFINTGSVGSVLQMQVGNTSSFVSTSSLQVGYANTATTSTFAAQLNTILQAANASYYPTFVDSNNATATSELVYTTSSFSINPMTGNVGLGVTPNASNIFRAIEFGNSASSSNVASISMNTGAGASNLNLFTNAYYNGTNFIYVTTGTAARYQLSGNTHNWSVASSGTPTSIISFTQAMTLDASGNLTISTSTNATSTSTGALTVAGGVGIGRDMWIGGTATHLSTLASTGSVSQNALYVVGGVGIGSSLLVTGPAVFLNNVTFSGTSTYVYSTNTVYTDNLINIHVPVGSTGSNHSWSVDDGKDIGFIYHYYKGVDKDAFLGLANDSGYLEWYSNGSEVGGIFTGTEYGIFKTGGVVLTNNTSTYSTNTGALTVAGGVGIGGGLYVGGTITATNFVGTFAGTVSGTASTASQVNTILQTSDTSYYPTFVDSNNASATGELVYTTSSFSINARTGQLTVPSLIVTTNTNGLNIRIGDDVWIGDVDQANTFRVTGQQAGTSGYIIFGNSNTLSLGRAGTGPLTYGGDFTVNGTTAASSTATGALQIKGGAGIGGDLYAANIYTNGTRTIPLSIQEFTATAGQTTFTVAGGYTVGTVQVFANGVNLGSGDITASNGTTVVLTEARKVNDIIRVISGGSSTAVNNIQSFSIAMSVAMAM